MTKVKKLIALMLVVCIAATVGIVSVSAATVDDAESVQAKYDGIKVHVYSEDGAPNIYYWNSLPQNIATDYPGPKMTSEGNNSYGYTFDNVTKINMMFVTNGTQSAETTRNSGEWWYKNGRWSSKSWDDFDDWKRTDLREDSIYFVITTRFYDGDTGNNVHCWDDQKANNPDSDPAWRGDFKGLIEKLDYIKALGFSAIWITPVVSNASGYDYHGYHAFDFSTVDVRYESDDVKYQDLIDAAHEKGMKIVQDVVINHTGNFGEATLAPMFTKEYDTLKDLESVNCMVPIPDSDFAKTFPDYDSLAPGYQYQARLNIMKDTKVLDSGSHDTENNYHHYKDLSWESPTVQTGQIDGDCVDVNTENPKVAEYLNTVYGDYINMGVDAFRMDTEKHISRLTLNQFYFPSWLKTGGENFYVFGEVCTRVSEFWNHNIPAISAPFYTWAETDSKYINALNTHRMSARGNYNFFAHFLSVNNRKSSAWSNLFLRVSQSTVNVKCNNFVIHNITLYLEILINKSFTI